jgi:hypothetical protein
LSAHRSAIVSAKISRHASAEGSVFECLPAAAQTASRIAPVCLAI